MAPQVQRPRGRSKPGMSEEQQGTRVAGMEGRKGRVTGDELEKKRDSYG